MADDGWPSRSHADIVAKLSDLKSNHAYDLGNTWTEMYTKVSGLLHDQVTVSVTRPDWPVWS
ncbi:Uncharacterised protein [Mycobacteroides abscessus subsp. abscessus]|uniref:hypothetical protein n=1 Tax=Mycobacteroides abscessus TaxID=36809 RepID=UPI0009282614|nr:hypothetical protein [Mycobacteroides abscessus]SIA02009.1 Uncharacterised protein [Mycobacteroides abscessus subsp. abscessus]SKR52782.1 Uncharacterised protein [Mycobacteroides abscessus subsp. abscessus]